MLNHPLSVEQLKQAYLQLSSFQRFFFPNKLAHALQNYAKENDETLFPVYQIFCNDVWFFHRWIFPSILSHLINFTRLRETYLVLFLYNIDENPQIEKQFAHLLVDSSKNECSLTILKVLSASIEGRLSGGTFPHRATLLWKATLFDAVFSGLEDKIIALFSIFHFLNDQNISDEDYAHYHLLDRLLPYLFVFQDPDILKFLKYCQDQDLEFIDAWILKLEQHPSITSSSINTIDSLLGHRHLGVFLKSALDPNCITEINRLDDLPFTKEASRFVYHPPETELKLQFNRFSSNKMTIEDSGKTIQRYIREDLSVIGKILLKTSMLFEHAMLENFLFQALNSNHQKATFTLLSLFAQRSIMIDLNKEDRLSNQGKTYLIHVLQNHPLPIGLTFTLNQFTDDFFPNLSSKQTAVLCKKPLIEAGFIACLLLRTQNLSLPFGQLADVLKMTIFSFILPQNSFPKQKNTAAILPGITLFKQARRVLNDVNNANEQPELPSQISGTL